MMAEPVDGSDLPPAPRRGSPLRTVRAEGYALDRKFAAAPLEEALVP